MAVFGHKNGEFNAPLAESVDVTDGFYVPENSPEVNRPPLRGIDKFVRPQLPFLTARTTVALLSCIGFIILAGQKTFMSVIAYKANYELGSTSALEVATPYIILGGYVIASISAGLLATVYPANKLFGAVIAFSTIECFCVAIAYPHVNAYGSVFIMLLQSFTEGVTYPAFIGTMSHWAPPLERTRLVTLGLIGPYIGRCISWGIHELTFNYSLFCYLYGSIGILWCLLWLWLVFEKPAYHTGIETRELKLIESSLAEDKRYVSPSLKDIPWKAIFRSKPVYAIMVASYCRSCSVTALVTIQSIYFYQVYDSDLPQWHSILQFGLMASAIFFGGILADWLQIRKKQTTSEVRTLFVSGGFGMEVIFVLILAFTGTYYGLGITVFTMALICGSITISAIEVNHLDIAPRYAALLLGLSDSVASLAAYKYIYAVNKLVINKNPYNYKFAFVVMVLMYFIGAMFYGVFRSGQQQQWAKPKLKEEERNTSNTTLNEIPGWRMEYT